MAFNATSVHLRTGGSGSESYDNAEDAARLLVNLMRRDGFVFVGDSEEVMLWRLTAGIPIVYGGYSYRITREG